MKLQEPESEETTFFKGNHKLMSLNTCITNKKVSSANGFYFVVIGSISSSTIEENRKYATFAWLNNNNEYVISNIPINQVRFQINDSISDPYCKFKWTSKRIYIESTFDEIWSSCIIYVVLVLRSDQIFGEEIELNLK
jgi:hypothetical protein